MFKTLLKSFLTKLHYKSVMKNEALCFILSNFYQKTKKNIDLKRFYELPVKLKITLPSNFSKLLLISFLALFSGSNFAQSPPSCTQSITLPYSGNLIINSGQVLCVDGSGTLSGAVVVRSGAHLVMCGTGNVFGSLTVDPGGTYWRTPTNFFTGSLAINGNQNNNAANCTPSCSAPNEGDIGNEHSICFDGNPSAITSLDDGGATTFEWEYSNNGVSGWTSISGANSETYDPPSGLTADRWYRRRGGDCSPVQWSGYTNQIKVTVNARPTVTVNDATICEGDAAATFTAT
ncbi:MAG: hypothetical protein CMP63_06785, partial [Flavobacteriales bacterium]|nr:hypothetical protein [Flavobacteriales bacterium]